MGKLRIMIEVNEVRFANFLVENFWREFLSDENH